MKERRSLVGGLKETPAVQELEAEFVYGSSKRSGRNAAPSTPEEIPAEPQAEVVTEVAKEATPNPKILPQMTGRVPMTTRCRPEVASALKRASLQRQLAGAEPFYVQDIMEEALERWLSEKGYL